MARSSIRMTRAQKIAASENPNHAPLTTYAEKLRLRAIEKRAAEQQAPAQPYDAVSGKRKKMTLNLSF